MTDEETRAAEYRAELVRRAKAKAARLKALRGSPTAFRTLIDNWTPLIDRQENKP